MTSGARALQARIARAVEVLLSERSLRSVPAKLLAEKAEAAVETSGPLDALVDGCEVRDLRRPPAPEDHDGQGLRRGP